MEKYRIKLNSSLEFTKEEADIYALVSDLADNRKLTKTIMGLIRMYYGNPGKFEGLDVEKYTDESRQYYLSQLKIAQDKHERLINRKLDYLAERLLALEANVKKLYTLAESGKLIGIKERLQADYCAGVQLKAQIRNLAQELGYTVDMSNTLDLEAQCEDILAYIIEHYDGPINELRQLVQYSIPQSVATEVVSIPQQQQVQPIQQQTQQTKQTQQIQQTQTSEPQSLVSYEPTVSLPEVQVNDEDYNAFTQMFGINFG